MDTLPSSVCISPISKTNSSRKHKNMSNSLSLISRRDGLEINASSLVELSQEYETLKRRRTAGQELLKASLLRRKKREEPIKPPRPDLSQILSKKLPGARPEQPENQEIPQIIIVPINTKAIVFEKLNSLDEDIASDLPATVANFTPLDLSKNTKNYGDHQIKRVAFDREYEIVCLLSEETAEVHRQASDDVETRQGLSSVTEDSSDPVPLIPNFSMISNIPDATPSSRQERDSSLVCSENPSSSILCAALSGVRPYGQHDHPSIQVNEISSQSITESPAKDQPIDIDPDRPKIADLVKSRIEHLVGNMKRGIKLGLNENNYKYLDEDNICLMQNMTQTLGDKAPKLLMKLASSQLGEIPSLLSPPNQNEPIFSNETLPFKRFLDYANKYYSNK